jgi:hypothetical protein
MSLFEYAESAVMGVLLTTIAVGTVWVLVLFWGALLMMVGLI